VLKRVSIFLFYFFSHSLITTMGSIVPNGKRILITFQVCAYKTDSKKIDQCALDANGNLKDASEIDWSYDKDDEMPMASSSNKPTQSLEGMFNLNIYLFKKHQLPGVLIVTVRSRTSHPQHCTNG
jgi:hypothetical protein